MKLRPSILGVGLWQLFALVATACPVCDTDTGLQVREQLFSETMLYNITVTLAPLVVLSVLVFLIYTGKVDLDRLFTPRRKQ